MKKYFILAISLLLPFVVSAQINTFQTNVYFGLTGSTDVTALQEFLTQQGVYHGPISGNFLSLTLASVKRFQSVEGISPISGYVGPVTRGVINQILSTQVATSEENATTTQAPIDLSQQSTAPATPTLTSGTTPCTTPSGAIINCQTG
jgi:peptidoglycan hydrolase-like protein with peptidoglycan-binding domain